MIKRICLVWAGCLAALPVFGQGRGYIDLTSRDATPAPVQASVPNPLANNVAFAAEGRQTGYPSPQRNVVPSQPVAYSQSQPVTFSQSQPVTYSQPQPAYVIVRGGEVPRGNVQPAFTPQSSPEPVTYPPQQGGTSTARHAAYPSPAETNYRESAAVAYPPVSPALPRQAPAPPASGAYGKVLDTPLVATMPADGSTQYSGGQVYNYWQSSNGSVNATVLAEAQEGRRLRRLLQNPVRISSAGPGLTRVEWNGGERVLQASPNGTLEIYLHP